MPRHKSEKERKRVGVYIEEELLERFRQHYKNENFSSRARYGEFTRVVNELLRAKLNELDHNKTKPSVVGF